MDITRDLTKGNSSKQLAALAMPLIWGNILQQLYNTIDACIVGRYVGHTAFAAVGVAGSVMNLFLFVLSGSCNGISVIFAELYGKRSWKNLKKESFLSLSAGIIFTVLLSGLGWAALKPLLRIIQTPEEVGIFVSSYLRMIYLGLPAFYLYNWCSAALRAVGDTKSALGILVAAMVMNAFLDFIFVVYCEMGITGTAVATVISQLFAAAVCLVYMVKRHAYLLFRAEEMIWDRELFSKTVSYGLVSALHQSSLYIGKLLVQGAVNTAGTDVISAYTAATRIEGFANSFGDSGCAAVSVFTAQNHGAGKKERVKMGFVQGMKMLVSLGLVLSVLMAVFVGPAVRLLMGNTSSVVLENVQSYIRVIAACYTLNFIGSCFVGLYRGLGMVQIPVLGTILHISIRVILSFLWIERFGLASVAASTGIGWSAVVAFQVWVCYKHCK